MAADAAPVESVVRLPGFRRLWAADGISQLGTQFSGLAFPVLAVTTLGATEWQMGLLGAAGTAAFLLVGLPAGAWVDRWIKRRVMVSADLVRAAALAVIPLCWWLGVLEMWQLYAVAVVIGLASVFFDVAYQSYIPVLVSSEQIGDANSKLEATAQVARIGGPGAAGALLAIVSAPVVILGDAVSFLFSGALIARIRDSEVAADRAQRRPLVVEIAEGVRFVVRHPLIRSIVQSTAVFNFASTLTYTLLPLLVLRELGFTAFEFGTIFSIGAAGGIIGAVATPRFSRWIGEGTVISLSAVVSALLLALIPIAAGLPHVVAFAVLATGEFCQVFMVVVYNITQVTMRQRLCPPVLLGRMNASIRFVIWGVMPISGLVAGVIGTAIGIVPTMWIAMVGSLLGSGFVVFSPLTRMRELPREQLPVRDDRLP